MVIHSDRNNPPFKIGDKVKYISDADGSFENDKIYKIINCTWTSDGNEWLVSVKDIRATRYSYRFELVDCAQPLDIKNYRRKGYRLEIQKPLPYTEEARRGIAAIYKFRKGAAQLYKFDNNPGSQISALRRKFIHSHSDKIYLTIVNDRYDIYRGFSLFNQGDILKKYKAIIKQRRAAERDIETDLSQTQFCRNQFIHTSPNNILNFWFRKSLASLKKPTTEAKYLGIELEFGIPKDFDLSILMPWKDKISLGEDRSIQKLPEGYIGREIRLLTTASTYKKDLQEICETLLAHKAIVNETCGLHVHLDMRNQTQEEVKTAFVNLVKSQKYLQGMVNEARRVNRYCKPTRQLNPFVMTDRYHAINGSSYHRYQTLEIRLHHGTLDATEIINWIQLLIGIIRQAPVTRAAPTLKSFMDRLNVSDTLREYVEVKIKNTSPVTEATIPLEAENSESVNYECTRNHENENCVRCLTPWGLHTGHNCPRDRQRGSFTGCSRASNNIEPRPGVIAIGGTTNV